MPDSTPPNSTVPILLCLLAFFLGSVPFGFVAGKLRGIDLREQGSKNIGATNTLRVLGKGPGIAVLLLDTFKGYLPVLIAQQAQVNSWWIVAVGLSAILGHIYSPFVRFKGGKGVATSLGVLIGLSPIVAGLTLLAFLIPTVITRYVSLGSLCGAIAQAALFWLLPPTLLHGDPLPYRLFGLVIAAFVIVRHRANITRLMNGTENKFGAKKS